MAAVQDKPKACLTRDKLITAEEIANGRVELTTADRTGFGQKWKEFVKPRGFDPYLHNVPFDTIIDEISGFDGWVRQGHLDHGHQVSTARVQTAIRDIGQTCKLERGINFLYRAPQKHIRPLIHMFTGFKKGGKLPVPEIAIPVGVPDQMATI